MAKYVVHYEMRKNSSSMVSSKTVECETEMIAVQIVESQATAQKPGYNFILRKVERR